MKKILSYIICAIIGCLSFQACETELSTIDIDIDPKLVINGLFAVKKDTCFFYVTESRPVFRPLNEWYGNEKFNQLKNAIVNIKVCNKSETLKFDTKSNAFLYMETLQTDDYVEIEASHRGRLAKSVTRMPASPTIVEWDTITFHKITNGTLKKYLRFNIKIKDSNLKRNYYRLIIRNGWNYRAEDPSYSGFWSTSTRFYSEDPVLSNGVPNHMEEDDYEFVTFLKNYLGVFNDNFFDGKEYELSFYIDHPSTWIYNPNNKDEIHLCLKLQSISEDLYKYYNSVQRYAQLYYNEATEPVFVFTNVYNGLGIVGAYNETVLINDYITYR